MKTVSLLTMRRECAVLVLALCFWSFLTGCNPSKPAEGKKSAAAQKIEAKAVEPPALSEEEAGIVVPDLKPGNLSEPDKAWSDFMSAMNSLSAVPPQWQTNEPSKEEMDKFMKQMSKLAGEAADKAKDFYTRFPQHEKAETARKQELGLLQAAVQMGATNRQGQLQALEDAQLKNPDLTEDQRLELRVGQLQRQVTLRQQENPATALAELEKGVRALQKEFPKRPEMTELLLTTAQGWLSQGEAEKSRVLAREILAGDAAEEVKAAARELVKKADRVGKPLDIKFAALDGREVDLQKMKGKVVLIDFWATWCRPCLGELPKVKAVYEKFHAQGFEIIGISFDEDKGALQKLLASEKMTWPQYFDAEDAGKKWGEQFGISGIPTMWLVDKKGNLRELNAREDLAGKVEKLLKE